MKKIFKATALLAGMAATGGIMAATDGVVSDTASTGTLEIDVTVNDAVRISGLADINATFDGTNDIDVSRTACVYRNATGGNYAITGHGDGAGQAFTIDDSGAGGSTVVPYQVFWNGSATALTANSQVTGLSGAHETSITCGGTPNSTVRVLIGATDLLSAPATTLLGTLTLIVAPQ